MKTIASLGSLSSRAALVLPAALIMLFAPAIASAQDDCAAVRQTRAFAESQGLDSPDLERLERRACRAQRRARRGRAERRAGNRTARPARPAARPTIDNEACQTLTLMEMAASMDGDPAATTEVAGARNAVCTNDFGPGALQWANGRTLRSSSGTYHWPSGRYARTSGGTFYYPSGRYARTSSGTWYYPTGRYAKTSSRYYTADGSRLNSQQAALLYACQRRPNACQPPPRGNALVSEAALVAMLWAAG